MRGAPKIEGTWPPARTTAELAARTEKAIEVASAILNGPPPADDEDDPGATVGVLVFSIMLEAPDTGPGSSPACLLHNFTDQEMLLEALKQITFKIEEGLRRTVEEEGSA
jgi:hypothetical protein